MIVFKLNQQYAGLLFLKKKKQKDFFESGPWALVYSTPMA
jgi:hypothetical protein